MRLTYSITVNLSSSDPVFRDVINGCQNGRKTPGVVIKRKLKELMKIKNKRKK